MWRPLGPYTELYVATIYAAVVVLIVFTHTYEPLPKSHFQELTSGNEDHFGVSLVWYGNFGQLFASWAVGIVSMAWMGLLYAIWHRLSPKFHVYTRLARNLRLHIAAGSLSSILCFVAFFAKLPQPMVVMAAALDVIHFCTTLYQMRVMMFGHKDIIYPEYLWLMLVKLGLAIYMVIFPADAMPLMRYGVTLSAFSFQRLFIFLFRAIYTKDELYVLATTLCGVLGGWQAIGCFWAAISLVMTMGLYTFVLKGTCLVGPEATPGQNPDRKLNLFKSKSMVPVKKWVLNRYRDDVNELSMTQTLSGGMRSAAAVVYGKVASIGSTPGKTLARDSDHEQRQLAIGMGVTKALFPASGKNEEGINGSVEGLTNVLYRLGFHDDHVERMLASFGLEDAEFEGTFSMAHAAKSKELKAFLMTIADEFVEQVMDDGTFTSPSPRGAGAFAQATEYTLSDLSQHGSEESLWVSIHGTVYDLTKFAPRHPGGPSVLLRLAGSDATEAWVEQHGRSEMVKDMMRSFSIGCLSNDDTAGSMRLVSM